MGDRSPWRSSWGAPRLLTREQVRAYLQIDDLELVRRMRSGQVPRPLWGCQDSMPNARWDRVGIDKALDRASTIPVSEVAAVDALDRAFGLQR